jgi:photosystem II stability/assembly factor-like uncharacterized protein
LFSQNQDWTVISPVNNDLTSIKFLNANTGIIIGDGLVILKTTNAGATWVTKNQSQYGRLNDFCFVNQNLVIIVAQGGATMRSTDQGETWSEIDAPVTANLYSVSFIDNNTGFATGSSSTVIRTTNAGLNWESISVGSLAYFSCKFFDVNTGITAHQNNAIKRTTNGGVNWITVCNTPEIPEKILFKNESTGFVVGAFGFILKTTNSGSNWATIQGVSTYTLNSGKFLDQNIGLTAGRCQNWNKGIILKTINGGDNWMFYDSINAGINDVAFGNDFAIVVCDGGKIYKSNNRVGIHNINSVVPSKYNLSQNYPNPFNPTTNINFSIPKSGLIKLTVYDITGKEVVVLVNQVLLSGSYKADFNASNLSSGTYFYRLETSNFSQTKKMLFVK